MPVPRAQTSRVPEADVAALARALAALAAAWWTTYRASDQHAVCFELDDAEDQCAQEQETRFPRQPAKASREPGPEKGQPFLCPEA